MLEQLGLFLSASILLTLAPGPDIIFVLVQGMANGKKAALATALGLSSGILIHTSLVAFGVSAILKESQIFYLLIRFGGAIYLCYLAFQVFKSDSRIDTGSGESVLKKSAVGLFRRGFLMNVLNPKVAIFFLAFFPGFLWNPSGNTLVQFYLLGLLFMLQALLLFSGVALLSGKISLFLQQHPKSGVVLKWLQIIVFVGIAFSILLE